MGGFGTRPETVPAGPDLVECQGKKLMSLGTWPPCEFNFMILLAGLSGRM